MQSSRGKKGAWHILESDQNNIVFSRAIVQGRSWKSGERGTKIMKGTINHVKCLGLYCPRDIEMP